MIKESCLLPRNQQGEEKGVGEGERKGERKGGGGREQRPISPASPHPDSPFSELSVLIHRGDQCSRGPFASVIKTKVWFHVVFIVAMIK